MEFGRYQIINIELKNDLIILVFYVNLTDVRKEKGGDMRKFSIAILCFIGFICAAVLILGRPISYTINYKKVTVDTSNSMDGQYELQLQAVGEPKWPFGSASGNLLLKKGEDAISQTDFEIRNDGGSINARCWKVTWYKTYVEVVLSGEEQLDERVTLHFDGSVDRQQVANEDNDYVAGEEVDESRVMQEQSFEVELNQWGKVHFVSYLPADGNDKEDVSFVLTKDNQIIYHFPMYFENNRIENDGIGVFDSIEAVGFQDIDGDGEKDVVVIINYVIGTEAQGIKTQKTVRIFKSQDNSFVIQHDLIDEIMKNMKEDDISISTICDYVTLMETDEIYDGYCMIYQQYFVDEGYDFVISYNANGNSRVILKENEEMIEYLVYDRLSENEKCELYVLYTNKKTAEGSWYISEAKILDIFAYEMSTKDVISSGKTSWSVTGNEKYHEITGEK